MLSRGPEMNEEDAVPWAHGCINRCEVESAPWSWCVRAEEEHKQLRLRNVTLPSVST